ncbi:MAG: AAA family ATPase [Bacteroidia bacterium]|nr:AAA family ATPase [Bacteroidia bacterium]
MVRLPYGQSHYATLRRDGYYYVDRTGYIAELEKLSETFLIFLRPRRFGKSLWLSTLAHYYGHEHAENFDFLFGGLTIGQNPTPLANRFWVLHFDFSRVTTDSNENTFSSFRDNVRGGIADFCVRYLHDMHDDDRLSLLDSQDPTQMLKRLLELYQFKNLSAPIYLLIDEYDHFTNELISYDLDQFQTVVSRVGWVRKFYETIKSATGQGIIVRIFMTGVSPITLNSLTSGFNIAANLTRDPFLHGMMGFTGDEVLSLLPQIGVPDAELPTVMTHLRRWYNGYAFTTEGTPERLYNPDMVLFFAKEYQKRQAFPPELLDTNIASDYGKIRQIFRLGGQETHRMELLQKLLAEGKVTTGITTQFSFEKTFTRQDFLSLLFYMGLLTIQDVDMGDTNLRIPNTVVEKLYFDYFRDWISENLKSDADRTDVQEVIREMARYNQPSPLMELIAATLNQLSNRDFLQFNETSLKMMLMSYLHPSQLFYLRSEHESGRGYVDLILLRRPPLPVPHQFAFELKYLKKKDARQLPEIIEAGRKQLRQYLQNPELRDETDLHPWLVIFAGTKLVHLEELN